MKTSKMKLPKTFRTEKNLDNKIQSLLEQNHTLLITKLLENCGYYLEDCYNLRTFPEKYGMAMKLVEDVDYTFKHIEILNKELIAKDIKEHYVGLYLSALINSIIGKNDVVTLSYGLANLGAYMEQGMIVIEGDAEYNIGIFNKGGKIIVKGNVNDYLGYRMKKGEIIVEGSANNYIGYSLQGGEIYVKKNAGIQTGQAMEGGKIFVNGDIEHIGLSSPGGSIYHKWKKVDKPTI